MNQSALTILWICSWYPNDEDQYRGDFIQRQAEALSGQLDFELAHFVEYASKNEIEYVNIANQSHATIGYSKTKNKLLSFRAQWKFYNRVLKEFIKEKGKPDLVHLHIPWKAGFVVRYWLKKHNIPYVVSEHYGIYNQITSDNFLTKSRQVQKYYHKIISSALQLITVSKSLGDEMKAIFNKSYVTIPNVVNTDNFYFKNKTVNQTFDLLHISNMYPIKNTDKIISAFANAHNKDQSLRLHLVGAQPTEIVNQISDLRCKNAITVQGEVPYKNVGSLMQENHAFILFSDWETQSCVALEALCSGRPVITSQVGGVQELISSRNGILVEPNNEQQLMKAILELKNNYSQFHLEQIAKKAQEKYAYHTVAQKLIQLYQNVLGR
jgi:glycosyltransferase involved in cell wall biosynthesis